MAVPSGLSIHYSVLPNNKSVVHIGHYCTISCQQDQTEKLRTLDERIIHTRTHTDALYMTGIRPVNIDAVMNIINESGT
jgi:hypothetical protein